MMKPILILAAVVGIVAATQPVNALETRSVTVSYADLDIGSAAGMATLQGRIKVAARQVCGGRPDARELGATERFADCYRTAIDGTRQQLADARSGSTIVLAAR